MILQKLLVCWRLTALLSHVCSTTANRAVAGKQLASARHATCEHGCSTTAVPCPRWASAKEQLARAARAAASPGHFRRRMKLHALLVCWRRTALLSHVCSTMAARAEPPLCCLAVAGMQLASACCVTYDCGCLTTAAPCPNRRASANVQLASEAREAASPAEAKHIMQEPLHLLSACMCVRVSVSPSCAAVCVCVRAVTWEAHLVLY